jgi:hypothetical protein
MENKLNDKTFNIDGFFGYINNLSDEEFSIPHLYKPIVASIIDNMEHRGEFAFNLPTEEKEITVRLKDKKNILKVLDYIIQHFYKYEIYEFIGEFLEIKKFYEEN